jgi:glycosyltransferase involved in cell wall biosynthesis
VRLFVVEPLGGSGMIHFAYQLCQALAQAGIDVTLVTSSDYELSSLPHDFAVVPRMRLWPLADPRAASAPAAGLPALWYRLRWQIRRGLRGVILFREWLGLTGYLLARRPDVIQFSTFHFSFFALFVWMLRRRGRTLTQICHEYEDRDADGGLFGPVQRRLEDGMYRRLSAVFFLSEEVRRRFLARFPLPPARTFLIPHGNQSLFPMRPEERDRLRRRYRLAEEERVALFFGAIRPSKGLEDLIDAFSRIAGAGRRLLVVGFPSKHVSLAEYVERTRRSGIDDRVTFDIRYLPFEQVGALFDLATVVVLPYRNATQSGVLHLAYTFGRPVVATAVGGLTDDVEDGVSGLLVPPGDPAALAAAVGALLGDRALADRMGGRARELAETRHSWQAIAARIKSVYEGLAAAADG